MSAAAPAGTAADLVEAAVELFGEHGFDGVSTRMLAEAAGTNLSSIRYHFGGKHGLYVATLEHVIARIRPRVERVRSLVARLQPQAAGDRERRAVLVREVAEAALSAFLDQPDVRRYLPLMVRELVLEGPEFQRVYEGVPRLLHETLTELVAWIDGRPADSPAAVIRAHALLGTFLSFHLAQPLLLARLGAGPDRSVPASLDATTRRTIVEEVTRVLLAALALPAETPDGSRS